MPFSATPNGVPMGAEHGLESDHRLAPRGQPHGIGHATDAVGAVASR